MNDNEMKKRLNDAFTHATPDILDSIITSCEDGKGKVIVMKKNTDYGNGRNGSWFKILAVAALLVLFIGCGVGALSWRSNHMVVSTIALDVNPGIELEVNKKEKVLEVKALNEAGKAVIGEMNLKDSDLDVAVNALIGSMLKNGYLSELANSILVSVECADEAKAAELQARLTAEIESMFQNETFDGAVLSQTILKNEELQKQADAYEITAGKAQLIEQLVKQNAHYTFEELAALSINELNLLSESGSTHLENVESVGTASEKEYIGVEKAKEAAFAHAGVAANAISSCKVEMDYENKMMVYEIEFISGAYEYDYEINALTGAVVKNEKERKDHDDDSQANNGNNVSDSNSTANGSSSNSGAAASGSSSESQNNYIGKEAAKEAALKHAGVTADSIRELECKLDKENGLMVYEIEFKSGSYEYDYEINATTGSVVRYEKDKENDGKQSTAQNSSGKAAGSTAKETTDTNGTSADVKETTNVKTTTAAAKETQNSYIGEAKAKEAALKHAGVAADSITGFEWDLDKENGLMVYEIEFKSGNYEYSYDINAETGAVVSFEKDTDD